MTPPGWQPAAPRRPEVACWRIGPVAICWGTGWDSLAAWALQCEAVLRMRADPSDRVTQARDDARRFAAAVAGLPGEIEAWLRGGGK